MFQNREDFKIRRTTPKYSGRRNWLWTVSRTSNLLEKRMKKRLQRLRGRVLETIICWFAPFIHQMIAKMITAERDVWRRTMDDRIGAVTALDVNLRDHSKVIVAAQVKGRGYVRILDVRFNTIVEVQHLIDELHKRYGINHAVCDVPHGMQNYFESFRTNYWKSLPPQH